MLRATTLLVTVAAAIFTSNGPTLADVVIETVTIGNAGTAPDTRYETPGYGGVDYVYRVGKFEVTAGQYTEFLNAVADDDTYGLYSTAMWEDTYGCKIQRTGSSVNYSYSVSADWADRPVNYINWGDAARFANWLHNGQPTGVQDLSTTEDGSYLLDGATTDAELLAVVRALDATWVIPSEDEWYKAAYYDSSSGVYYDFPTGTDDVPSNELIDPDPGNTANFWTGDFTIGDPYYRTEVGEFEHSPSPYGTFDQGGNVFEWNEALIGSSRGVRGGSYGSLLVVLHPLSRYHNYPTSEIHDFFGLRVGYVPEPGTLVMLALGAVVMSRNRQAVV